MSSTNRDRHPRLFALDEELDLNLANFPRFQAPVTWSFENGLRQRDDEQRSRLQYSPIEGIMAETPQNRHFAIACRRCKVTLDCRFLDTESHPRDPGEIEWRNLCFSCDPLYR